MNEPEDDKRIREDKPKPEEKGLLDLIIDDVRENGFWGAETLWATLGCIVVAAGVFGIMGMTGIIKGSEADQVIFFWMAVPFLTVVAIGVLVLFLVLALMFISLISMIPWWVWLILVLVLIFR